MTDVTGISNILSEVPISSLELVSEINEALVGFDGKACADGIPYFPSCDTMRAYASERSAAQKQLHSPSVS